MRRECGCASCRSAWTGCSRAECGAQASCSSCFFRLDASACARCTACCSCGSTLPALRQACIVRSAVSSSCTMSLRRLSEVADSWPWLACLVALACWCRAMTHCLRSSGTLPAFWHACLAWSAHSSTRSILCFSCPCSMDSPCDLKTHSRICRAAGASSLPPDARRTSRTRRRALQPGLAGARPDKGSACAGAARTRTAARARLAGTAAACLGLAGGLGGGRTTAACLGLAGGLAGGRTTAACLGLAGGLGGARTTAACLGLARGLGGGRTRAAGLGACAAARAGTLRAGGLRVAGGLGLALLGTLLVHGARGDLL